MDRSRWQPGQPVVDIAPEDPAHPDARRCMAAYFAELAARDDRFDPAASLPATDEDLRPPAGLLLVARTGAEPVGCAALKLHREEPAEVKRMWVSASVRGLGVGRRLLAEIERHARDAGVRSVRLETNAALVEAIGLYRRSGFVEVPAFNDEPFAHHWFEKQLREP